ncbi:TetR/AcrR family transcriptional regulator [Streptomyces viridochromogenes]|uniref:TetR/AcrR family transcriptional regulator n=1 Tax=Streptomyces viridochromogenes TaxID=1938 RepID=UPI0001B4D941|nr:TetR family transcriptional regulator [Streptomyces viridochromogenes]
MSVPNLKPTQGTDRHPGKISQRERKKARTRTAIQQEALRLFRDQGYEATTIEQIAEAAEVSASTVFRYFATKEDLVLSDDETFFVRAFRAQPPELPPVQAMRRALHSTLDGLSASEMNTQRDRDILMVTVPELWSASLGNVKQMLRTLAELVAERTGADPADAAVRALSGAIFGIMMDVMLRWANQPDLDPAAELDRLLACLEDGFQESGA